MPMRARVEALDERPLHMHAAHQHGVGPGEVGVIGRLLVLVDEAHLPFRRQIG
jgi:hypothetical protein